MGNSEAGSSPFGFPFMGLPTNVNSIEREEGSQQDTDVFSFILHSPLVVINNSALVFPFGPIRTWLLSGNKAWIRNNPAISFMTAHRMDPTCGHGKHTGFEKYACKLITHFILGLMNSWMQPL
jgi:hypothetical protein